MQISTFLLLPLIIFAFYMKVNSENSNSTQTDQLPKFIRRVKSVVWFRINQTNFGGQSCLQSPYNYNFLHNSRIEINHESTVMVNSRSKIWVAFIVTFCANYSLILAEQILLGTFPMVYTSLPSENRIMQK